jgi:hypothetical protein
MKSVAQCIFEDQNLLNDLLSANTVTSLPSWFRVSLEKDAVCLDADFRSKNAPIVDGNLVRHVIREFGKLFWQLLISDKSFDFNFEGHNEHSSIDRSVLFLGRNSSVTCSIQVAVCQIFELSFKPNVDVTNILQIFENVVAPFQEVKPGYLNFSGTTDEVGTVEVVLSFDYSGLINSTTNQPHGDGILKFDYPSECDEHTADSSLWNRHEIHAFFVRGTMLNFNHWLIYDHSDNLLHNVVQSNDVNVKFTWGTPRFPKYSDSF